MKNRERGFALLVEVLVAAAVMAVMLGILVAGAFRIQSGKDAEAAAGLMYRVLNAEQIYGPTSQNGYVPPANLTGTLGIPQSCSNPRLLSGQDSTLISPRYNITFVSSGTPSGFVACPPAPSGGAQYTLLAEPKTGIGRFFYIDSNYKGGVLLFCDGKDATCAPPAGELPTAPWYVYPISEMTLSLTSGSTTSTTPTPCPTGTTGTYPNCVQNTPPPTPPTPIADTLNGYTMVGSPTTVTGILCFPALLGTQGWNTGYSVGSCGPNGGATPMPSAAVIGSATGYSTFTVTLLNGASVPAGHEVVFYWLDLGVDGTGAANGGINNVTANTLATCKIVGPPDGGQLAVGYSTPDKQNTPPTNPTPPETCVGTVLIKPAAGDFTALILATPSVWTENQSQFSLSPIQVVIQ